ncbi:MAG: VWA domain-containing protein [Acidobacteria bacterium]|nr:VWA domain-containing protein [Acidobacteriota bacterium]
MRRLLRAVAVPLLLLAAALPAAAAVRVKILAPAPQQPVFGQVVFEVQVVGSEAVDRVEFLIDGKPVGVVRRAPYRLTAEVGDDNRQREFRAVVYGASGASAADRVVTLPVRIDEQMNVRLQQLFVTVMQRGARTLGLDQEHFRILDNGQEQKIVTFDKGELPITAVLLLDSSESMQGELLAAAEGGARAFIAGMRPLDQAMMALFSDQLLRVTDFTADHDELQEALTGVEARGGTAVNDFLYMSLKLLEGRQGRRVVVLLSDGSDVNSVLSMADVLRKARTSQSLIYWIQLEGGGKHKSYTSSWRGHAENDKDYRELEQAVEESGGRIQRVDRTSEIEPVFRGILQELREQFAIGYYPTNLKGDGAWHNVKVTVSEPGCKVRTANGYVDF